MTDTDAKIVFDVIVLWCLVFALLLRLVSRAMHD